MTIRTIHQAQLPECLRNIPSPPRLLYVGEGSDGVFEALMQRPRVAIVGSRNVSAYGRSVTMKLARELAEQGIAVISGLALGVDAVAHRGALEADGLTLAVLPGPVEHIYPRSHVPLAQQILQHRGVLLSEYPAGTPAFKQHFVARNRIVAGLADVLLITEAVEKSGTLHTARFALEQGIDVLAVPGDITSLTSAGTNNLLKAGAAPVTSVQDVLHVLGREPIEHKNVRGANVDEQKIIDLLLQGTTDAAELLAQSQLTVETFNHHLTMLEITSTIRPLGNNHWALR